MGMWWLKNKIHTWAILVVGGKQKAVFHTFLPESVWCSSLHGRLQIQTWLSSSYCLRSYHVRFLISPNKSNKQLSGSPVKLALCDIIKIHLFAVYQDKLFYGGERNWCALYFLIGSDSWSCQTLIHNSDLIILLRFLHPSLNQKGKQKQKWWDESPP